MVNGTVLFAATADCTEVGKLAVRHCTQVPLEALAKYFAVGFVYPIGWPVFGLRLGAGAFTVLSPPALPFRVLSWLIGAGGLQAFQAYRHTVLRQEAELQYAWAWRILPPLSLYIV